jgi:hypothetical protein
MRVGHRYGEPAIKEVRTTAVANANSHSLGSKVRLSSISELATVL